MRTPTLAAAALALCTAQPFTAQDPPRWPDRIQRPPVPAASPVRVSALEVDLKIDGPTMRVTQKVTLSNPDPVDREFDLIFPLGSGSVISGLSLDLGGRVLEGNAYPADAARRVYQEIARRNLDPALLEHYGEAMYRARVFPVPARGSQVLTLSYTRVVEPEGELLRAHVPLTAFRRAAGPLSLLIRGEVLADHPITTLYSPTHELDQGTTQEVPGERPRYRSSFAVEEAGSRCELDLLLYLKARAEAELLDVTVLSERPDPGEDGYFLAVINGVPDDTLEPEPKNVVFVLDHSGSMEGVKMSQARDALKFLVDRLRPQDRFNVIGYSVGVEVFAAGLQSPGPEVLASVHSFLDGVRAEGGTNIEEALKTALAQFRDRERVGQIVFLTDGLPTVGERDDRKLCKMVREANAHGARVVAFGVGFDVNGAFLDRLAVQNRGLSEYVLPSENIEDKVPGFYARMQAPLLLDTRLEIAGVRVHDLYPRETGDIYGGHQVLLTGRYSGSGEAVLNISGRRGGEPLSLAFPFRFAADSREGTRDLVARLWAAKMVGFLVDEIRLNGEASELVNEIVRLGTRFGILTEYTSFLAAEETDLLAFGDNLLRCEAEIGRRAGVTSGAHGFAQASNSKKRQRVSTATLDNRWLDERGRMTEVLGVQCVAGKTFFKRGELWLDSTVALTAADVEVEIFSDEFFALLDGNGWLPRCVARTGETVVSVGGTTVRLKAPVQGG